MPERRGLFESCHHRLGRQGRFLHNLDWNDQPDAH
jgi:hypothetical protein